MPSNEPRHRPQPRPEADENASPAQVQAELAAEVAHLRQVVHGRAVVDQAVGVLIMLGQISVDEAWDVLREVSMHVDVPLREVAQHLVEFPRSGELPDAVRAELDRHLTEARRPAPPHEEPRDGRGSARGDQAEAPRPPRRK
ncbi:ANTAR domain-containing protein [Streptomyces sp. NPDC102406]|uniref:ANTAR domain-containing protein n=1 Tax=Streptomyces sp. NPDC102406 TaxID=3366171 RepID=UPI00382244E7